MENIASESGETNRVTPTEKYVGKDIMDQLSTDLDHKVINPERDLCGLWRIDIKPYGGLLLVKRVADAVEGWELVAPSIYHFLDPLGTKPLFRISLSGNEEDDSCVCLGRTRNKEDGPHKALLKMSSPDAFEFKCSLPEAHLSSRPKWQDFINWVLVEPGTDNPQDPESDISKTEYDVEALHTIFSVVRKYNFNYQFTRLGLTLWDVDIGCSTKPIQPGVFKGSYGELQLVELTYVKEDNGDIQAMAMKITGDVNVPAGEWTFKANLSLPINFETLEEQSTMEVLQNLEVDKVPYLNNEEHPSSQHFGVPSDCSVDYGWKCPDACKYRFAAVGQCASQGFIDPEETKGHWIVFNEDLFGLFWFEFQSLSLYDRVKDITGTN